MGFASPLGLELAVSLRKLLDLFSCRCQYRDRQLSKGSLGREVLDGQQWSERTLKLWLAQTIILNEHMLEGKVGGRIRIAVIVL